MIPVREENLGVALARRALAAEREHRARRARRLSAWWFAALLLVLYGAGVLALVWILWLVAYAAGGAR